MRRSIDDLVPKLVVSFKDTDAVTLVEFLADVLPSLLPEVNAISTRLPTVLY